MNPILSRELNMDDACVELKLLDGTTLAYASGDPTATMRPWP